MNTCKHDWTEPPECPQCIRDERDELKKKLGTLAQQFDALSNLICNASDTLRSRGFEAPTPFDERVIKLAQAYDALMAIAVAANSDAPIPNRLDEIEKTITAAQEKGVEIK